LAEIPEEESMSARPLLLLFAACALVAVRPAFSQSVTDKPSKSEPSRSSAWTTVTYPEGSAPRGKLMFARFCEACHGAAAPTPSGPPPGPGGPMGRGPMVPPGTAELQVKYGSKEMAELEKRTNLTAETVIYFVRHGTGVMPPIRKTELSDADLKSISDYLAHRQ
jgi:cytochrome c5